MYKNSYFFFIKSSCFLVAASFIIFFISVSSVKAYTYSRNLSIGISGSDVYQLQKTLNSSVDTQISSFGAGSPGQETYLFGALTQKAVVRFQSKYSISPTGFVGPLTREKLSTISLVHGISPTIGIPSVPAQNLSGIVENPDQYKVNQSELIDIYQTDAKINGFQDKITNEINSALEQRRIPNISFTQNVGIASFGSVLLNKASAQEARPGTPISLSGVGFTGQNTIYFGNDYVVRNIPASGNALSFTVPSLPAGRYDVVVKNNAGISNSMFFIIKDTKSIPVLITSVSPQTVSYGDTVTITGSGFTTTNNEIQTTFGIIQGVASPDSKTLSFIYKPESYRAIAAYGKQNKTIKVDVVVVNNNGFTKTPGTFTFSY